MLTSETVRLPSGRSWQVHRGGSGPALLWLHGLRGVDAADPLLAALLRAPPHHRARWRRASPISTRSPRSTTSTSWRSITTICCDGLRLEPLAIVGHSFGAMMAAEIAAHVPARAARLVLLAPRRIVERRLSRGRYLRAADGRDGRTAVARHEARATPMRRALAAAAAGHSQAEQIVALARKPHRPHQVRLAHPRQGLAQAPAPRSPPRR